MTLQLNWRDDAACRDADPELFFPVGTAGPALRQIRDARRICCGCPAQAPCLAWALDHGITDGVWGGTTEDQRRAIRSLALLAPWFARRTVADLAAALAGTSVPWAHADQVNTALPMSGQGIPPDPGAAGSRYGSSYGAGGNGRLTLSRLPG